ncbi:MAG: hypothetical protein MUE94_03035 [Verrucomicrobia bacterium]|jgi:hypothetical protein|nr:hypothetical protein [Verrucomicrobiota bacterium]
MKWWLAILVCVGVVTASPRQTLPIVSHETAPGSCECAGCDCSASESQSTQPLPVATRIAPTPEIRSLLPEAAASSSDLVTVAATARVAVTTEAHLAPLLPLYRRHCSPRC